MTRGFYDQLGVDSDATPEQIRGAYLRLVGQFNRRRAALLERGGDPERLELARHQADEAFTVLSDPARRRRYDAMIALAEEGLPRDEEALWAAVEGAVVAPAVSAAMALLQAATGLAVQPFPPAPSPALPAEPEPRPLGADVVKLPRGAVSAVTTEEDGPQLRVVEGAPKGAPVIVMPTMPKPTLTLATPPAEGLRVAGEPAAAPPREPSTPAEILAARGPSGATLRAVRERAGLSLEDVGEQTRIAVRFLSAIEEETFDRLPSATFVRGYVREIAAILGLDEEDVVEGYMERFHGSR
jgi:curved DNA-binding protein CbpA